MRLDGELSESEEASTSTRFARSVQATELIEARCPEHAVSLSNYCRRVTYVFRLPHRMLR